MTDIILNFVRKRISLKTQIYHTLNSGIFLKKDNVGLAIDIIHGGSVVNMNSMSAGLLQDMRNIHGIFSEIDAMLFTHIHCDHFNKKILEEFRATPRGSHVPVYCPGYSKSNLKLTKISERTDCTFIVPFAIFFITTVHDADIYKNKYHRSIIVRTEDETILIAGDAKLEAADITEIKQHICDHIDTAIINPFQAVQSDGRTFLKEFSADNILIYHIPDKEIDKNSYGYIAKTAKKTWPAGLPNPSVFPKFSFARLT